MAFFLWYGIRTEICTSAGNPDRLQLPALLPFPRCRPGVWHSPFNPSLLPNLHRFSGAMPTTPAARTDRYAVTGHQAADTGVGAPPASLVAPLVGSGLHPSRRRRLDLFFRSLGAKRPIEIQNKRRSRILSGRNRNPNPKWPALFGKVGEGYIPHNSPYIFFKILCRLSLYVTQ